MATKKINTFTKNTLKEFRVDFETELAKFGKKYGVSIKVGNIRFTPSEFKTTVSVNVGNAEDAKKLEYERYCVVFGMTPKLFGKKFTIENKTYKICGLKPKGRKYPILGSDSNGKIWKFPVVSVVNNLKSA